jgi:hypothetical protein
MTWNMNKSLFQNEENSLPEDRRLRADGFIIRAQATIRTDSFSSVQDLPKAARCARQPRPICTEHTIRAN